MLNKYTRCQAGAKGDARGTCAPGALIIEEPNNCSKLNIFIVFLQCHYYFYHENYIEALKSSKVLSNNSNLYFECSNTIQFILEHCKDIVTIFFRG